MKQLSEFMLKLKKRFFTLNEEQEEIYELDIYVRNLEHLNKASNEIAKLSFVSSVERVMR